MKGRGLERDLKMGEDMSDGERQIDTAAAAAYEEHLVAKVFGPWAERVVEIAAPIPGEAVLDAACGTGAGARVAAPRVAPGDRWWAWTSTREWSRWRINCQPDGAWMLNGTAKARSRFRSRTPCSICACACRVRSSFPNPTSGWRSSIGS